MIFRKSKIGSIAFVIDGDHPYHLAMPSTRIRCYDVINYLKSRKIDIEVYDPGKDYDTFIFQKLFDDKAISLARELKSKSKKIIFDINVNYIDIFGDQMNLVTEEQQENIKEMLQLADHLIVSSPALLDIYSNRHQSVFCIEESVSDAIFSAKKKHKKKKIVNILYCGFGVKAVEIELIKDVLVDLNSKYKIKLLLLTDYDPELDIIPYDFIKYDNEIIGKQLVKGDIKIAPRKLDNSYNMGHSFTKVAYPMAAGLPVVASPVPAYKNREVIICETNSEWYSALEKLIISADLRQYYGLRSKRFVRSNFSMEIIGNQYFELLNYLLA